MDRRSVVLDEALRMENNLERHISRMCYENHTRYYLLTETINGNSRALAVNTVFPKASLSILFSQNSFPVCRLRKTKIGLKLYGI